MRKIASKNCIVCSNTFTPRNSVHNTCSYECAKVNKSNKDKEYKDRKFKELGYKKTTIYNHECLLCSKKFTSTNKNQNTCSRLCFHNLQKTARLGENNPSYRNGMYSYKSNDINKLQRDIYHKSKEFEKNAKIIRENQLNNAGFFYCEHCKVNNSMRRETHHIVYRSEKPKHPELHNIKNLIRLCIKCHNNFHKDKSMRNKYVIDRKLNELFGCNLLFHHRKINAPKNKTTISQGVPTGQEVQDESIQVLGDGFDSNVATSEYPEGYPFVN